MTHTRVSRQVPVSNAGCATLTLFVAPGAERWAPSPSSLSGIACALRGSVRVEVWPRTALPSVWREDNPGRPLPGGSHGFRAYTRDHVVKLFVDDTETPDSVLWLLHHELAHVGVTQTPGLVQSLRRTPRPDGYPSDDEAHERHPEERHANAVADAWMTLLHKPTGLDRLWWRKRVQARRA